MENRIIHVLAIDDHRNTLISLSALITNAFPNAEVCTALGSQQGLDVAATQDFDVIFLSIAMSAVDAFEVCTRLKTDQKQHATPVVFITAAKGDTENCRKALACGAEAFLSQPIDEMELTAQILAMLKIKAAAILKRDGYDKLEAMVDVETRKLQDSNLRALQLFADSKAEQTFTQAILDSIPGYLYVYDENGRLIKWNKQHETMTGYSAEELAQMTLEKWFDQEDIIRVNAAVADIFEKGFGDVEANLILKNGERMMTRSSGAPLIVDGHQYFTGIGIDITEQKKIQDDLRVSEEKYRRLFETMSQGVVYQAANGKIISANPAAERVLGMTLDQMQSVTSIETQWDAIREDGSAVVWEDYPVKKALRTGQPYGPFIMAVFQPKINDHVWLSITATPLFKPGETVAYQAYALFQDITAERKAQQNYMLLFQEMLDAFALHEMICDEHGQPVDYRFLAVNPAFEKMTGFKSEDIVGKTVLEMMPNTEKYWIETYGKVALTGEPTVFENYSIATGKYFSVSAYQPTLNQFACTFTDITNRILSQKEAEENLSRLQGLLENSPSPIMIIDQRGYCVDLSSGLAAMLSLPKKDLRGKEISRFVSPKIAEKVMQAISNTHGDTQPLEDIDVFELHGEVRYVESRLFPIPAAEQGEKLFGYIGIDVTERMSAERSLKESEERYSSYIKNAPDGIVILNEKGQFIEVNDAAIRISGYTKDELITLSIMEILANKSIDVGTQLLRDLVLLGSTRGEVMYFHKDRSIRWAKIGAVKLSDTRFLAFMSDITDQKKAEEDLLYTSRHDYLTGLYNRSYFDAQAECLNKPEHLPLSVIIGDINGLKLINDSFGRNAGDTIIIDIANILKRNCRTGDVLAKTSGDEFSILLPQTSYDVAIAYIDQLKAACQAYRMDTANDSHQISISFGAGTKETMRDGMIQAYKAAEINMNQHKLLEKRSTQSNVIASIQATMLEKSHETEAHSERLAQLARNVGLLMHLSQTELDHLELLATLHDIGKIGISEQILNKPGSLTEIEWVDMKKHPEIGYRIALSTANLAPIAEYILCHHEKWDGTGYPQSLAGNSIPLLSRILTVVDAYDAMTQDRVYRKAMSHEKAIAEIIRNAGTQFDPHVVDVFCDMIGRASPTP